MGLGHDHLVLQTANPMPFLPGLEFGVAGLGLKERLLLGLAGYGRVQQSASAAQYFSD